MLLKRFALTIVIILMIGSLLPIGVVADDDQSDKGRIEWQIDRISENRLETHSQETELERTFPDLFATDTREKIDRVLTEQDESIKTLRESIFTAELNVDSTVEETKEMLFADGYVAPNPSLHASDDTQESGSSFWMITIAAIASLLSIFVWFVFQRMAD